jgi:hypothetical protein
MIHLAELNENNICIGVKTVMYMINDGKHIEIPEPDFEYYVWRKYENGVWSIEKFEPPKPLVNTYDSIEQRIADLEAAMAAILGGAGV